MSNAKYKFYYANGEIEELETTQPYTDDAKGILKHQLNKNVTWLHAGGKYINLANVISIEVLGDQEKLKLNPLELKP